jgi:autotransporter strand-loop-strand O-heptosyltransferase
MKYELINSYTNTELNHREIGSIRNSINITFTDGAKVEITGQAVEEYEVKFIDIDSGQIIYGTSIKNNMWCAPSQKYYVNWKVEVRKNGGLIRQETLSLQEKRVKIVMETQSMGDIIAYIGAVEAFGKKHKCKTHCVVFNSSMRQLLEKSYKDITFLALNERDDQFYASYSLGFFDSWQGRLPRSPQHMSLAEIAGSILGFGEREFKPTFQFNKSKNVNKKYVCISTQSTSQFKYWNNPVGWDEVIKHLNSIGYEVWCIDRYQVFGNRESNMMNSIPKGAVDKTGDVSLEERMQQIYNADFFIGLSSGLSWLAWAVGVPVIMISGIGKKWTEFFTPFRVINESVCNGCTNDTNYPFDKSAWAWCPKNKNFECTSQISSNMVIFYINKIISNDCSLEHFDWGDGATIQQKFALLDEFFDKTPLYEKILEVEKNDVLVDIGAHIGAFSYAVKNKIPKKIIAIEPSSIRYNTLQKNLRGLPVTYIKKGIGDITQKITNGLEFAGVVEDMELITFSDFIKDNKLTHIDFLKVDCEGGEYSIFDQKNIEWIISNVRKISGEWHLKSIEHKEKFKIFRDKYLTRFKNYHVYSIDGVDIKWDLFNEHFTEYYNEVIIHIDNRDRATTSTTVTPLSVLITGASGGLGSALEACATERGIKSIGHANKNPNGRLSCDFSDISQIAEMEKYIVENNINCLINNAGVYKNGTILELADLEIKNIITINLIAPILLSKYLYKHLTKTGQAGYIVNINSLAGKYPNYNESVYCASKFGLSGFGSSLSINQKNSKIKVIDIYPGAMKSHMTSNRPNYSELMDPVEISNFIFDLLQTNREYITSAIEIRNVK